MASSLSQCDKKALGVFSLASFLHDVGSDMIFSIWPLFITQVLGANVAVLGLIDGLGDALVSISQAISGYASDRLQKRKVFVWLGYLFGGIARIGYALSPTWQFIIPFRVLDRSGKIRSTPRDAIISEMSHEKTRGSNFGVLRMADNSGAVVGILLTMLLIHVLELRQIFLLAAIPSLLSVILICLFIHEKMPEKRIFKGVSFSAFQQDTLLYTVVSGIFSLATFSYSFLLLFAGQREHALVTLPIFYLIFTFVAAVFSLPFGKLSDRIGRKKVLYISYGLWLSVLVLLLLTSQLQYVVLAFVVYGLHKAALDPVQTSFIAELAPKEILASTLGGFQLVIGLMSLPSSLIAGILWQQFGSGIPFVASIALTVIAILLLSFVKDCTYRSS